MELPFLPGAGADISKSESALGPWPSGAGATRKSCSSATLESLFKKMRKRWKKQDNSAEEKVEEARYFCHALNFGSGFRPQNNFGFAALFITALAPAHPSQYINIDGHV